MKKLREKFTYWYINKGYTFGYEFYGVPIYIEEDSVFRIPWRMPKAVWDCPLWVKPLLIFFSPSIYHKCVIGKIWAEAFVEGFKGTKERVYAQLEETET